MKAEGGRPKAEVWTRVAVRPSHVGLRDAVSAALFAAGAEGLHEEGESLVTHLEFASEVDAISVGVRAVDAHAAVESREIPAVDWSIAWRDMIRAHEVGTLTVAPPWLAADLNPATTIVIEPAMAFGTGDHPTTRGVLRLMQRVVREGDLPSPISGRGARCWRSLRRNSAQRVSRRSKWITMRSRTPKKMSRGTAWPIA